MQITPQMPQEPLTVVGYWKFQRSEQIVFLASGEIVETITQTPPQSSYRYLDITDRELIYHHEQVIGKKTNNYKVIKEYRREGNILFVTPSPNTEQIPLAFECINNESLNIQMISSHEPGEPYTKINLYFVRWSNELWFIRLWS
ncbi:hypothetical protein [Hymenobacter sp. B81]|uniref:hypothetical protein n=1 Tax=Hymenobacter sp. B81 TaxID=3344878 RepID=UPI0037DC317F